MGTVFYQSGYSIYFPSRSKKVAKTNVEPISIRKLRLQHLATGVGSDGREGRVVGTTGVATALATGRFLAFLTAPGFLGGRSPELESESRAK